METTGIRLSQGHGRSVAADLTIEALAYENEIQRERIASLEDDVTVYREMNEISLSHVARLTAQLQHARHKIRTVEAAAERMASAFSHPTVYPAAPTADEAVSVQ